MSEKPIVPTNCFFQGCYNSAYEEQIRIGKEKCYRYNQLSPNDREGQKEIHSTLLDSLGREVIYYRRRQNSLSVLQSRRKITERTEIYHEANSFYRRGNRYRHAL